MRTPARRCSAAQMIVLYTYHASRKPGRSHRGARTERHVAGRIPACGCADYVTLRAGALSSAWLEHLPYKQGVGGSSPSAPMTRKGPSR